MSNTQPKHLGLNSINDTRSNKDIRVLKKNAKTLTKSTMKQTRKQT